MFLNLLMFLSIQDTRILMFFQLWQGNPTELKKILNVLDAILFGMNPTWQNVFQNSLPWGVVGIIITHPPPSIHFFNGFWQFYF